MAKKSKNTNLDCLSKALPMMRSSILLIDEIRPEVIAADQVGRYTSRDLISITCPDTNEFLALRMINCTLDFGLFAQDLFHQKPKYAKNRTITAALIHGAECQRLIAVKIRIGLESLVRGEALPDGEAHQIEARAIRPTIIAPDRGTVQTQYRDPLEKVRKHVEIAKHTLVQNELGQHAAIPDLDAARTKLQQKSPMTGGNSVSRRERPLGEMVDYLSHGVAV